MNKNEFTIACPTNAKAQYDLLSHLGLIYICFAMKVFIYFLNFDNDPCLLVVCHEKTCKAIY